MLMEIKEVIEVVDTLNNKIYELIYREDDEMVDSIGWVTFQYYEDEGIIEFMGHPIWYSGEDERKYIDEELDIHEPLIDYVLREIKRLYIAPIIKIGDL